MKEKKQQMNYFFKGSSQVKIYACVFKTKQSLKMLYLAKKAWKGTLLLKKNEKKKTVIYMSQIYFRLKKM